LKTGSFHDIPFAPYSKDGSSRFSNFEQMLFDRFDLLD
jgi:hypothetical protein